MGSLDDLAATNDLDPEQQKERYAICLALVRAAAPPPDDVVACLIAWMLAIGIPGGQILRRAGLQLPDGPRRAPALTAWSRPQPGADSLPTTDLMLVIEIDSDGTEAADYAKAGITHYWRVYQGENLPCLIQHRLGPDGGYVVTGDMPLEWLPPLPLAWIIL